MATMADLDELALAMPQTTKELSDDGRPTYLVHGKFFCFHRSRRRDAIDPDTGERLDDVLVFRVADVGVKELMLADDRRIFFTTPHWNGYSAVLIRIPDLARLDRDELEDAVVEAWLARAQKRVAKAWLDEHRLAADEWFSSSAESDVPRRLSFFGVPTTTFVNAGEARTRARAGMRAVVRSLRMSPSQHDDVATRERVVPER